MCCYDITEVVMSGGHNIFKGTGSPEKYIRSMITDEVDKGFTKSSNRQGVFEILETFKKKFCSSFVQTSNKFRVA